MASDLTAFGLAEMLRCSIGLRRAAAGATTFEAAARAICAHLRNEFRDAATGERQLVLARLYRTHPYGALEPTLQAFADRLLGDHAATPELRCLCLMGTVGEQPAWNDRRDSSGHQAIPLPTPEAVAQAPMIAQLARQFGLDFAALVLPAQPSGGPETTPRTYGVFHVSEARHSPYIPAQEQFVVPYGVRSVVGFGGALRSGDIFAGILFSRVSVTRDVADRFRNVALDAKAALFEFGPGATFDVPRAEG